MSVSSAVSRYPFLAAGCVAAGVSLPWVLEGVTARLASPQPVPGLDRDSPVVRAQLLQVKQACLNQLRAERLQDKQACLDQLLITWSCTGGQAAGSRTTLRAAGAATGLLRPVAAAGQASSAGCAVAWQPARLEPGSGRARAAQPRIPGGPQGVF